MENIEQKVGNGYDFPIQSEPCYDMGLTAIPGYQLIRRLDSNKILTINSRRYSIKTHKDVVDTAETAMGEFPDLRKAKVKTYIIRDGNRLLRKYTFDHIKVETTKDTFASMQLALNNSYDRTCRVGISLGAESQKTRYFCASTEFNTFRKKHYEGLDLVDMKNQIQSAIESFSLLEKTWTDWKREGLNLEYGEQLITKAKLPEKYKTAIVEKWALSDYLTKWDLFNASCIIIEELGTSEERKEVLGNQICKVFYR